MYTWRHFYSRQNELCDEFTGEALMARKTKEDAIATRSSLIDAAEEVFGVKGVSRASLSDIAEAAGATRGAIYWHFKDKVDLFGAMMDRVSLPLERSQEEWDANACLDPVQRLLAAVVLVLNGVATDEKRRKVFEIALYKVEYVGDLVGVRDRHLAASEAFTRQLAAYFESAQQCLSGHMPMSAMEAAVALHALVEGLIRNWIIGGGSFDLLRVGRAGVDAFLRGLGLCVPSLPTSSHGSSLPTCEH
jgi:TetR/AcrR family acrAB operon transcriptional repressor